MKKSINYLNLFFILVFCGSCLSLNNSDKAATLNKPATISVSKNSETKKDSIANESVQNLSKTALDNKDLKQFSKKFAGNASARSVELNSPSFMESTCKHSIKKENAKELIESALTSVNPNLKPDVMVNLANQITEKEFNNIEVSNCSPKSEDGSFAKCECELSYNLKSLTKEVFEKPSLK